MSLAWRVSCSLTEISVTYSVSPYCVEVIGCPLVWMWTLSLTAYIYKEDGIFARPTPSSIFEVYEGEGLLLLVSVQVSWGFKFRFVLVIGLAVLRDVTEYPA